MKRIMQNETAYAKQSETKQKLKGKQNKVGEKQSKTKQKHAKFFQNRSS